MFRDGIQDIGCHIIIMKTKVHAVSKMNLDDNVLMIMLIVVVVVVVVVGGRAHRLEMICKGLVPLLLLHHHHII